MSRIGASQLLRCAFTGGVLLAWAVLAHLASAGETTSDFAVVTASAPLVAVVVILLWRVGNPLWLLGGTLAVLAVVAAYWSALRENIALLYFLQHAGAHLALAGLFGRSLFVDGESLVTRFARLAHHGVLSPAQLRYTRQVTIAWTIYFVAVALLSTVLFLFASPSAWSVFANLLAMPLLGLMFVAEYLVRHRVLPPADRTSIADTIRGYRESLRDGHSLTDHP